MRRFRTFCWVIVFTLVLVVFLFLPSSAKVTHRGNLITYEWYYVSPAGYSMKLQFSLDFRRGYDHMQKVYRRLGHGYRVGRASRFIFNDPFYRDLRVVAITIIKLARERALNEVEVALSFVQSLPYEEMGNYQRYAVETLIDGRGDCSDKSVLLAGLLEFLCYDWVFLLLTLENQTHLLVGVWSVDNLEGVYVSDRGRRYYFCETTVTNQQIGYSPWDINAPATLERPNRKEVIWKGPYSPGR